MRWGIDVDKELTKEQKAYRRKHKPAKAELALKKEWLKRTLHVCKPCWELKYCPYGPLVEQFPHLPPTRDEAKEHNEFVKRKLVRGEYKGWRKKLFTQEVKHFDPRKYPKTIAKDVVERTCTVFGHLCPVFFVNEPFTETEEDY